MSGLEPPYQSLDHLHTLCSQISNVLADTEGGLSLHLLHHHIQSDESPGATHTCTAVYQQWCVLGGGEQFTDMTNDPYDRHEIVWNSVIWPGCVVELSHCHWLFLCQFLHEHARVYAQCQQQGLKENAKNNSPQDNFKKGKDPSRLDSNKRQSAL